MSFLRRVLLNKIQANLSKTNDAHVEADDVADTKPDFFNKEPRAKKRTKRKKNFKNQSQQQSDFLPSSQKFPFYNNNDKISMFKMSPLYFYFVLVFSAFLFSSSHILLFKNFACNKIYLSALSNF